MSVSLLQQFLKENIPLGISCISCGVVMDEIREQISIHASRHIMILGCKYCISPF